MRTLATRRGDGERGATLVEFALIAPILFLILFAMLDIGLAVIGSSVASNAAREGARVGIINYENADTTAGTPTTTTLIEAAVDAKLVGLIARTRQRPYVEVRCLDGGGSTRRRPCTRRRCRRSTTTSSRSR